MLKKKTSASSTHSPPAPPSQHQQQQKNKPPNSNRGAAIVAATVEETTEATSTPLPREPAISTTTASKHHNDNQHQEEVEGVASAAATGGVKENTTTTAGVLPDSSYFCDRDVPAAAVGTVIPKPSSSPPPNTIASSSRTVCLLSDHHHLPSSYISRRDPTTATATTTTTAQQQQPLLASAKDTEREQSSSALSLSSFPQQQQQRGGDGGGGVDTELLESAGVGRLSMLGGSTAAGVGTMPMAGFQKGGSLKIEDTILRLNIGGSSYRIRTKSILKHGADSLLGRFVRMNDHNRRTWADAYFEEGNEYFFERVPRYFDPIYDYYATGKLHVPKDLCFEKFMAELRFWAVDKAKMDDCCSPFAQYYAMRKKPRDGQGEKDHFIGLRCAKVRRRLWLILEGHTNSRWWRLFEFTSTSFVVLSITALILSSMPDFQVPEARTHTPAPPGPTYPTYHKLSGQTISSNVVIKEPDDQRNPTEMVEHPVFNYVENICVIYFTMEYMLRFWVAPMKSQFVREFLNVIDLLAIAPFVFEMLLMVVGFRGDNIRKVRWALLTVRLLRVLRVVRIAKLGRFSPGLANFALTLQKSKRQMQMVAIVLLTVIIFFSTLIYFLERDEPDTTFVSIPAAFWWCLFSQTKWVPQTAAGKLAGGAGITFGVLVLALPIAILVNNFMMVVKLREETLLKQFAERATVHGDHV